jgi:hypothetical protein
MKGTDLSDLETYVKSAREVELMALALAHRNVEDKFAIQSIIEASDGDLLVMRRAHRHCERALSEQWPAGVGLIRAFDYLSGGLRQLEIKSSQVASGLLQPPVGAKEDGKEIGLKKVAYDIVDEAGMESFPASDAPSFWARDPQQGPRSAHSASPQT